MSKQLEDFYRENYRRFVNQMSGKLGGDRATAEDVVQEAFTRAVRFLPAYDPERGTFSTWFNVILYTSLRHTQRINKVVIQPTANDVSCEDLLDTTTLSQETRKILDEALEEVGNNRHKYILELFFIMGYTSSEIPNLVEGTTQSNVTTVVTRFKRQLEES